MANENQKPVTPVPDKIQGENLPYRGFVDHGVPTKAPEPFDEVDYYEPEGRPVELEPEKQDLDPVPVFIVDRHSARQVKAYSTISVTINPGERKQICGRDVNRTSLRLLNNGNVDTVYFGDQNVTDVSGYPLFKNSRESGMNFQEPLYAYVPPAGAGAVTVCAFIEYNVDFK